MKFPKLFHSKAEKIVRFPCSTTFQSVRGITGILRQLFSAKEYPAVDPVVFSEVWGSMGGIAHNKPL